MEVKFKLKSRSNLGSGDPYAQLAPPTRLKLSLSAPKTINTAAHVHFGHIENILFSYTDITIDDYHMQTRQQNDSETSETKQRKKQNKTAKKAKQKSEIDG